jgi:hypothetical protein
MFLIQRPIGTDREANAVERERISLANGRQIAVRLLTRDRFNFARRPNLN